MRPALTGGGGGGGKWKVRRRKVYSKLTQWTEREMEYLFIPIITRRRNV
jgi:hypothetical protein